ncbi:MAG: hypothetical protein HYU30_07040 [Chloroflexi bacterium]|nr:hypothetical protein [Chloroflexota bacterium]
MALRLAGETFLPIQGTDGQGWVREIAAKDNIPGLKIDQQGTGRVFDFQDGGASKLYLPDGGSVSLVGSLVFDLANDVTLTPASPFAPRALTIPDPGGDDSFVFLAATQTLTGKTLTAPVIQGSVGAGSGLTMPAFTAGGNITGGSGFKLLTSAGNLLLDPAGETRIGDGVGAKTFKVRSTNDQSKVVVESANVAGKHPTVEFYVATTLAGYVRANTSTGHLELSGQPGGAYVILTSSRQVAGDPTGVEGMVYINTIDNAVRMYADGAWRSLATW